MRLGAALVGVAFLSFVTAANAALTSSEKGQIKDFVGAARAEDAQKVRSLVARTDLTAEESAAVLSEAIAPVAFTEQRGKFLRELAFGGASAASRPVLAVAEVKAVVARADAIYQRYVGGLDHEPKAIDELVAIYGWLDQAIANAGKPTTAAHDGAAGIPAATYDECSKVLRDHLERQARWLKGDGQVPASVVHLRAQAQLALVDMLPDGLTRRVDAADRLGLKGARRALLTESGVLFADAGTTSDEKVERVRQVLAHLPGARADLSAIELGASGRLSARGEVVNVGVAAEPYPFAGETPAPKYDATTSAVAHELSVLAAKRALDGRAEFRTQIEHDVASSSGDTTRLLGRPRAPSVEHILGAAIHAVITDAPRAIDVSFARLVGGRPETAALLSDALGAMGAFVPTEKDAKEVKLEVGKASEWAPMTAVRLAPNGVALAFTIDGHAWAIDRASPSYAVLAGRRDGKPVSLNQLSSKGIPRDGAQWIDSGYTFNKMRGAPRVALAAAGEKGTGPNVKLIGAGNEGFDVVTVAAPAPDFVFEGTLDVHDAPGGVAFRTSPTAKGFRGGALVVSPKGPTVLAVIEDGAQTNLGTIDPSPTGALPVKIRVTGKKVEAVVGKTTLSGTLPDALSGGDVAVIGKKNANVDISAFTLKRN